MSFRRHFTGLRSWWVWGGMWHYFVCVHLLLVLRHGSIHFKWFFLSLCGFYKVWGAADPTYFVNETLFVRFDGISGLSIDRRSSDATDCRISIIHHPRKYLIVTEKYLYNVVLWPGQCRGVTWGQGRITLSGNKKEKENSQNRAHCIQNLV